MVDCFYVIGQFGRVFNIVLTIVLAGLAAGIATRSFSNCRAPSVSIRGDHIGRSTAS